MSNLGLQSQSQRRFLASRRPDVVAAWESGRTLSGRTFTARPTQTLPVRKSGARVQRTKRRRGRI
jgi:hypothetical protein